MAGKSGGIRAGKAYVEMGTDNSRFEAGLKAAQARLRSFGASAGKIGTAMASMSGVALAPITAAVFAASDLQETMSKFNTVFGRSAGRMKEWGDEFAGQIGRSKKEVAGFLAGSQDLFIPLGFEPGAAEELSKTVTKLAVDLASFNNTQDADTMRDLQAALTGSGEVMKKYGVIVSEAAVGQELLRMGLDPKAADNAAKVQARLNIIMAGTTAAQGDAARTAGSFANQMKALKARLSDTAAEIGTAVLPLATELLAKVAGLVNRVAAWAREHTGLIITLTKVAAGAAALGVALVAVGKVATMASTGIGVLSKSLAFLAANPAVAVAAALAAVAVALGRMTMATDKAIIASQVLRDELDKALSEQAAAHAEDRARLQTLTEILSKQSRTAQEQLRANAIAKELRDRYGEIGITWDAMGNAIGVQATAMERITGEMRKQRQLQLETKLAELYAEYNKVASAQARVQGTNWLAGGAREAGSWIGIARSVGDEVAEFGDELQRIRDLEAGLRQQLEGVQDYTPTAAAPGAMGSAPAQATGESAEDWARRVHQLQLGQIEDRRQRELAILDDRYEHEIKKAQEAQASAETLRDIRRAWDLETAALQKQLDEEAAEARRREIEEFEARKQARLDADAARSQEIEELRLRTMLEGVELERALLDLQRQRAIEAAVAAGQNVDLVRQEYALREQLQAASGAASQTLQIVTRGTFSAAGIKDLDSRSQTENLRGILAVGKETARNTQRLLEEARRAQLVFG